MFMPWPISLAGQYDLPHGVANAMLLPVVEEYNIISNPRRFADIAEFMGEHTKGLSVMDAAEKAVDAMRRLASDVGHSRKFERDGGKRRRF